MTFDPQLINWPVLARQIRIKPILALITLVCITSDFSGISSINSIFVLKNLTSGKIDKRSDGGLNGPKLEFKNSWEIIQFQQKLNSIFLIFGIKLIDPDKVTNRNNNEMVKFKILKILWRPDGLWFYYEYYTGL